MVSDIHPGPETWPLWSAHRTRMDRRAAEPSSPGPTSALRSEKQQPTSEYTVQYRTHSAVEFRVGHQYEILVQCSRTIASPGRISVFQSVFSSFVYTVFTSYWFQQEYATVKISWSYFTARIASGNAYASLFSSGHTFLTWVICWSISTKPTWSSFSFFTIAWPSYYSFYRVIAINLWIGIAFTWAGFFEHATFSIWLHFPHIVLLSYGLHILELTIENSLARITITLDK